MVLWNRATVRPPLGLPVPRAPGGGGNRELDEVMSVGMLVNVRDHCDPLCGDGFWWLPSFHGVLSSMGLWELPFLMPHFPSSWTSGLSLPPGCSAWPEEGQSKSSLGLICSSGRQRTSVPNAGGYYPRWVGGWEELGRALMTFFESWTQLLPRPVLFLNFSA